MDTEYTITDPVTLEAVPCPHDGQIITEYGVDEWGEYTSHDYCLMCGAEVCAVEKSN